MKKDQIKIGGLYVAKVSDKLVSVRIDNTHSAGGWMATNTATGKVVRIKSAQRLRSAAGDGSTSDAPKAMSKPTGRTPSLSPKTEMSGSKKSAVEKTPKKVSALDAAAKVLAKADKPMRSQELIAAMEEGGLWKSPGGKTPHATLYAAILREISAKGKDARFTKCDRGLFTLNG